MINMYKFQTIIAKIIARVRSVFLSTYYFYNPFKSCYFGQNVRIDGNVIISKHVSIDDNVEVRNRTSYISFVGSFTSINRNCVLRGYYKIGENCAIAPNCTIVGFNHGFSDNKTLIKRQKTIVKGIVIGHNCWIGANSVILDGVTIGDGSVIGAGSVVTKNIPANSVAVGNPCKVIKTRV